MTAQRATLWVVLLVASTAVAAPTEQKLPEMAPPDLNASPSAAPLVTESANQGYRMPGLYGFGTKPFYLERDPETGAFDFSAAAGGNTQKYSSKVPAHSDYDYEEVAIESDSIDRKDTLGPVRPNDLGDAFRKPVKSPQVPLISSSYASTKLQGMGVSKQDGTTTTSAPSYYSQWPLKSTTEAVLDFWPPAKPSTTEAAPEYYDYEEEVSAEVSETHPPSPSPPPSPLPTTLPPFEFEVTEESETVRPIPPKKKQDAKKPELPLPPPTPETDIQPPKLDFNAPDLEFSPPKEDFRPPQGDVREPELALRPPNLEFRPLDLPVRPPQGEFSRPPQGEFNRPPQGEFNRPPQGEFNRPPQQGDFNRPPQGEFNRPPQGEFNRPPQGEFNRPPQQGDFNRPAQGEFNRPPQGDFKRPPQGEFNRPPQQGDFNRPPQGEFNRPPQGEFNRPPQGEFIRLPQGENRPQEQPARPLDTEMRPPVLPQKPAQGVALPPRYEPERPPQLDTQGWKQAQTPPPVAPPSISSTRVQFPEDNPNPTTPGPFRQPLPQGYEPHRPPPPFRLPHRPPPLRRPASDSPYAFVESNNKQIDRHHVETRPPPPPFRYRPHQQKTGGVRNRNDDLPNILPQFRPNSNPDPEKFLGFRQPPPPPPAKRLQPPTGPLVGRRVGSEVSTLQMMKGAMFRPPPRDDTPHALPPPPPPQVAVDNRQVAPADRADGPGVFVVYANSKANSNDVHVGTRGPHRPLPPSRLREERPILPGKSDFPYALEKPMDTANLQDPPPPQAKNPETYVSAAPTVTTVVRPHSGNSEFTVSAVMHAGPGGAGHQGQVFVVAPQHRPEATAVPPQHRPNEVITGTHHHHKNSESATPPPEPFLAPFHASANVAPAPGNGWTALREGEIRTQGIVERADLDVTEPDHEPATKFDIENFTPQLIGGFQPIMHSESDATPKAAEPEEKKVELQTADRQERR